MPSSNLDTLLEIILSTLDEVMQDSQHLSPTINDIYDTFNKIHLRIERKEENSQRIIKILKYFSNKKISKTDMMLLCLHIAKDNLA